MIKEKKESRKRLLSGSFGRQLFFTRFVTGIENPKAICSAGDCKSPASVENSD